METPLTPLEFARRARKLYPEHVAIVDGFQLTYASFRIDVTVGRRFLETRNSLGRPRCVSSLNTHAQLESFCAVPQVGAVLVPLNYRLTADDFVYLINHSGSA
jgi:fatty-acyl-CoA synthase